MNNNFYEIPNDWYSDFNNSFMNNNMEMPNISMISNMPNLVDPKVGLERGNLFNNLYMPYKNYKYKELKPTNRREQMLFDILKLNFAMTDLSLYLDVNPNDINMLRIYNNYLNDKKRLIQEYENNFGPLTLGGLNIGNNKFNWVGNPWPWEGSR